MTGGPGRVLYELGMGGPHRERSGDILIDGPWVVVHEPGITRMIPRDVVIDIEIHHPTPEEQP